MQQIGAAGKVRLLHREKLMVRLGQGVFVDGKLNREATERTIHALESFRITAEAFNCERLISFGTSALREASDSQAFLDKIRELTSIDLKVISGKEEAALIAEGILANEPEAKSAGKANKRFALIDIGGGSTEISIIEDQKVIKSESFQFGTARLQQIFLKRCPPNSESIDQLRAHLRGHLVSQFTRERWGKVDRIIGSSGTIRSLCKLLSKKNPQKKSPQKKYYELKDLSELVDRFSTMTTTDLLGIAGMESKRVDMILAGAILLEECLMALKAKKFMATEFSLRDGILTEQLKLYKSAHKSSLTLHLPDLADKGKKLGANESHFTHVRETAERLFDELRLVHRVKPFWRPYLSAAAILHDIGEPISPTNHEFHSGYIVRNAGFPMLTNWETELIALLCINHRGGKVVFGELKSLTEESKKKPKTEPTPTFKELTSICIRLTALLRLADAFDRSHKSGIKIKKVLRRKGEITLTVSADHPLDLEILRIEQKKGLFKDLFGLDIQVVQARKRIPKSL